MDSCRDRLRAKTILALKAVPCGLRLLFMVTFHWNGYKVG